MNGHALFGIIVSVAYGAGILILRWSDLATLRTVPLNEFGDFLAGVFGPLMLFWLILGYIQQQRELQQNTKALELQADELRNSVEQHKHLVEATRDQVAADLKVLEIEQAKALRDSQPRFALVGSGWRSKSGENFKYEFTLQNTGQPASEVRVAFTPQVYGATDGVLRAYLGQGDDLALKWEASDAKPPPANLEPPPDRLSLLVQCLDRDARPFTQTFSLEIDPKRHYRLLNTETG